MSHQPPPYTEKVNFQNAPGAQQMNSEQSVAYPTGNIQSYPPGNIQSYPPGNIQSYPPGNTQCYPPGNIQGYPNPPFNPQYNQNPNVISQQPYIPGTVINPQYSGATVVQTQYSGAPMTTVIYQANVQFSCVPVNMTCQYCHCQIITGIGYESGGLTWLLCFVLFLFVGFFGCCLIPFCVNACKDVHHFCPNCKAKVGIFRRM